MGGTTAPSHAVIPAKAGTQTRGNAPMLERSSSWVPAFAGMTRAGGSRRHRWQPEHRNGQVIPHGIVAFDKFDLPIALPFLDPFFANDCVSDVVESLDVDQALDAIFSGEAGNESLTMLEDPLSQVAGHTSVERTVAPACKDVDMTGHGTVSLTHIVIPAKAGTQKLGTQDLPTAVEPARIGSGLRRNDELERVTH